MMPDRLIRTSQGVLDGLLMIHGVLYVILGLSWIWYLTPARLAGINWLPVSITEDHVGWWWVVGGAITLVGAVFSRCRLMNTIAVTAAFVTPFTLALVFAFAWTTGEAPRGIITSVSYGSWAVIVAWVSVRQASEAMRLKEAGGRGEK